MLEFHGGTLSELQQTFSKNCTTVLTSIAHLAQTVPGSFITQQVRQCRASGNIRFFLVSASNHVCNLVCFVLYQLAEGGQPMPGIFVYVDSYFKTVFTFYQTFEGILYANINGEVIVVDDGSKVMTTGLPGWAITLIAIGCVLTVILLFFGLQRCCMLRRSRYQFM
jgi:hypothetical protein